jgi:SAM-dependent methyltransferase
MRAALPARVRGLAWRTGRRAVDLSARRLKLVSYVPYYDYREQLDAHTAYVEDARLVRDKRLSTVSGDDVDLTISPEGFLDVVAGREWSGRRMLEVGPKYGVHSLLIDEHLRPAELVFSDFAADRHLHERWESQLRAPHRWVYGDLRLARELLEQERFDVVFFLGVLYHSAFHLPLLGMLNRVTKLGGEMLLETTVDPRPDSSIRLRWQRGTGKAKAVPTLDALRIELAWTGWREVTRFADYRPGSNEVVLLCRKTDELPPDGDLVDLVAPQRREPALADGR